MAYAGDLKFNTKLDKTGFEQGTKDLSNKTSAMMRRLKTAAKAGAVAIGAAFISAATAGVKYNAQMEQYFASFETMLGNAKDASKHMADLKKMAAATPFEMSDLAEGSKTLMAFGVDVKEVESSLKMLGDISQGNKERFNGLALVFGQVKSQGKLMGQDLLQMINAGFNPLQVIAEKTGESMSSLKDKMAKGQITFEMVADAMKTATSEGGKFNGAMEKQSKTAIGLVSTLKDNVNEKLGEAFKKVSELITKRVLPAAIKFVQSIDVDKLITGFTRLIKIAASIAPVFAAIKFAPYAEAGVKGLKTLLTMYKANLVAVKNIMSAQQTVSTLYGKAAGSTGLYASSAGKLAVKQAVLNGKLTAGQIVTGLLAGKISIATAATAAWNAVLKINPFILAATAIGLLVGGIIAYNLAVGKGKGETDEKAIKMEKLSKAVDKAYKSFSDLKNQVSDQSSADLTYNNNLKELKTELDGIVDANGRVKAGYEARAGFIVNQLAKATGIEISLQDGLIKNYGKISEAIDNYLVNKQKEILISANEEIYTKAIKGLADSAQAYADADKKLKDYTKSKADVAGMESQARIAYNNEVKELKANAEKKKAIYRDFSRSATNASNAMAGIMSGDLGAINKAMYGFGVASSDMKDMSLKNLMELQSGTAEKLAVLRTDYEKTGDETTKKIIEAGQRQLEDIQGQLDKMTGAVSSNSPIYAAMMKSMMEGGRIEASKVDFKSLGIKVSSDISNSVRNGQPVVGEQAKALMAAARQQGYSVDFSGVGEGVVLGIHNGITAKEAIIFERARAVVDRMKSIMQVALAMNSPSRWARDKLIGKGLIGGMSIGLKKGEKVIGTATDKLMGVMKKPKAIIDVGYSLPESVPLPSIAKGTMIPAMVSASSIIKTNVAETMDKVINKLESLEMRDIQQNITFSEKVYTPADARDTLAQMARIGLAVDK